MDQCYEAWCDGLAITFHSSTCSRRSCYIWPRCGTHIRCLADASWLIRSGHDIILQCESDPGAQRVLKQKFPGVLLVPDICALPGLPQNTCLVHHVFRLLRNALEDHRGVPWVLLENVEGLLDRISDEPPAIEYVVGQLEDMGYSWAYRIVNTAGFGLPHRRKRVIVIASLSGDPRDVLLTQGAGYCHGACRHIFNGKGCYLCHQADEAEEESGQHTYAVDLSNAQSGPAVDVIPTMKTQNERICVFLNDGRAGFLRIEDAERLQGLPEGWTRACYPSASSGQSLLPAVASQDSYTAKCESYRWGLLGNAVSVPVAQWVGKALSHPYTHKYVSGPSDTQMLSPDPGTGSAEQTVASLLVPLQGGGQNEGVATSLLDVQFAALEKVPRHATDEAPQSRTRDSWPRAAWRILGMPRHAVEDMSEAPLLTPLEPLGEFLTELGQMPSHSTVSTYLARLAERGFNTYSIIRKAVSCGMRLSPEVTAVVRLKEGLQDLETLGQLAWCQTPDRAWWPCEVLDPWHMPPARQLPQGAAAALSPAKRRLSLPSSAEDTPNVLVLDSASSQWPGEAPVGPETPGAACQPGPSRARGASGDREFFVVLYGSRKALWAPLQRLLPFKRHLLEKQSEGQALIDAKKLQHPRLFKAGVKQALAMSELLSRASMGGEHAEAVAALAAAQACEENLQVRCGECEACLANTGAMRRCLLMRVCAAAAAGHSGAQIAVLGDGAIGARVSVWWRLDEKYYEGLVASFDRIRQRHTVFYDDGDIELIPLWAPNQMVKVVSDPKEWHKSAQTLRDRRQEYKRTAAAQRLLQRRAAVEASLGALPEQPVLTEYEQKRADNIARNARVLASMRLTPPQPDRKRMRPGT